MVVLRAQWIDGSFVTSKLDPGDIDVVTIFDGVAFNGLEPWQSALAQSIMSGHRDRDFWGIDSFAVPRYDANVDPVGHADYLRQCAYWHHQWGRVRDDDDAVKGYVEVLA